MKISAIKSYGTHNTAFGNKKNKEVNKSVHSSFPLKAVPLAVLLAINPVNTPVIRAYENIYENNMEHIIEKKQHMIVTEFKDATPYNAFKCNIRYIRNKKNDPDSEKLQLVFNRQQAAIETDYNNDTCKEIGWKDYKDIIDVKRIKKVNIEMINKNYNIERSNVYFVEGPGVKSVTVTNFDNNVIHKKSKEVKNIKIEISENLFNKLKNNMNDGIECIEETQLFEDF